MIPFVKFTGIRDPDTYDCRHHKDHRIELWFDVSGHKLKDGTKGIRVEWCSNCGSLKSSVWSKEALENIWQKPVSYGSNYRKSE